MSLIWYAVNLIPIFSFNFIIFNDISQRLHERLAHLLAGHLGKLGQTFHSWFAISLQDAVNHMAGQRFDAIQQGDDSSFEQLGGDAANVIE